jgi:hypothetical protein
MSAEGITPQIDLALERERRFARLIDHIDQIDGCDGPDGSVPGVSRAKVVNGICRQHPRYVLACLYGDRGRTFLHLADTLEQLGELASGRVEDAELIVAYYDLDQLVGDDDHALPEEVEYQGEVWTVHGPETDRDTHGQGVDALRYTGAWVLKKSPADKRRSTYDWTTVPPSECDLLGWEDERLPVRYSVAKVFTVVAFNTIPDRED